jgi:hypothetical protein
VDGGVLACGATAVLSHDSAATLWQLTKAPADQIHVSVLGGSRRSRNGLEVHSRTTLKITTQKGIRVTTPAQTLIDVASKSSRNDVEQAIGEATSADSSA